jgi:hypothetical protein
VPIHRLEETPQVFPGCPICSSVSRFFEDAGQIFETATAASSEESPANMAILIGSDGALRIVDAAGWRPDTLQAHYGARTVYQVTRTAGSVKVTGCSGSQTCALETARPLLPFQGLPNYAIIPPQQKRIA